MHPLLLAGYTAAHSRRGDPGIWKLPWESSRVGEGSAFPQVAQTLPSHSRSREKRDETLLPSHYRGYKSTLCREQKQGELRGQVVLLTGVLLTQERYKGKETWSSSLVLTESGG